MINISESSNNCQKTCSAKYKVLIGIVIFIMTLTVHLLVENHDFINFDYDINVLNLATGSMDVTAKK
jgi:hypothetical protein